MAPDGRHGAILVLPNTTAGQQGPVAAWISTSGWAAAAERVLGRAWVVTPRGVIDVDSLRHGAAVSPGNQGTAGRGLRRLTPTVVKTAVKDAREWQRARGFHVGVGGPWQRDDTKVEFVWQRHELFHTAGPELARALDVPLVVFVPALLVWQAAQWGVSRPGWGKWLEQVAEAPTLRAATVVACGSDVIADEATRLGVAHERIIITPTGVDLSLFTPPADRHAARRELGVDDTFVIGWVGSFRSFHSLDQLVEAAPSRADNAASVLLLVGDGPERARIERLACDAGVAARFTGTVAHHEIPRVLAAMDVAVVLADPSAPFHYSPLKVAEYLAAGVPVIAPDVASLAQRLEPGRNAVLYPAGDTGALRRALDEVRTDAALRTRLRAGALDSAPAWSWDEQVRKVRTVLQHGR